VHAYSFVGVHTRTNQHTVYITLLVYMTLFHARCGGNQRMQLCTKSSRNRFVIGQVRKVDVFGAVEAPASIVSMVVELNAGKVCPDRA
jgi:hypothetical protein